MKSELSSQILSYLFLEHPGLSVVDLEHLLLTVHHRLWLVLDAWRHGTDPVQLKTRKNNLSTHKRTLYCEQASKCTKFSTLLVKLLLQQADKWSITQNQTFVIGVGTLANLKWTNNDQPWRGRNEWYSSSESTVIKQFSTHTFTNCDDRGIFKYGSDGLSGSLTFAASRRMTKRKSKPSFHNATIDLLNLALFCHLSSAGSFVLPDPRHLRCRYICNLSGFGVKERQLSPVKVRLSKSRLHALTAILS